MRARSELSTRTSHASTTHTLSTQTHTHTHTRYLAVINTTTQRIEILDSLNSTRHHKVVGKILNAYIIQVNTQALQAFKCIHSRHCEYKRFKYQDVVYSYHVKPYEVCSMPIPKQDNSKDNSNYCGVYMCTNVENVARGRLYRADPKHAALLRKRLLLTIIKEGTTNQNN